MLIRIFIILLCVKIIDVIQNAMITSTLASAALSPAMMLLPVQLLPLTSVTKETSEPKNGDG
jgi:hypothetical protein